jgi:hypothetical protein
LAIASMFCWVGFAAWRGNGLSMGSLLETFLEDMSSSREL